MPQGKTLAVREEIHSDLIRKAERRKSEGTQESRLRTVDDIMKVYDWCVARGVVVEFIPGSEGVYIPKGDPEIINDTIRLGKRFTLKNTLYIFLHEAGHFLCKVSDERNNVVDPITGDGANCVERAKIIEEEFSAWRKGRKLATRLSITIDDDNWDRFKSGLLASYFKWAVKKGTRRPRDTSEV